VKAAAAVGGCLRFDKYYEPPGALSEPTAFGPNQSERV